MNTGILRRMKTVLFINRPSILMKKWLKCLRPAANANNLEVISTVRALMMHNKHGQVNRSLINGR